MPWEIFVPRPIESNQSQPPLKDINGTLLYLGDTTLDTAACYLAGLLHRAGYSFEYRPSNHRLSADDLAAADDLLILSDYPAAHVSEEIAAELAERIRSGSLSLLMIGGWESFEGCDGHWHGSPLADVLPVVVSDKDDRRNIDRPTFVQCKIADHPVTANLPWAERPPLIGGFNQVEAKLGSEVLLTAEVHDARLTNAGYELSPAESHPLLVVQDLGNSRVAALMTDLAPHWVGPLVDWGPTRVVAKANGGEQIEVGSDYARFVEQLIGWLVS